MKRRDLFIRTTIQTIDSEDMAAMPLRAFLLFSMTTKC